CRSRRSRSTSLSATDPTVTGRLALPEAATGATESGAPPGPAPMAPGRKGRQFAVSEWRGGEGAGGSAELPFGRAGGPAPDRRAPCEAGELPGRRDAVPTGRRGRDLL